MIIRTQVGRAGDRTDVTALVDDHPQLGHGWTDRRPGERRDPNVGELIATSRALHALADMMTDTADDLMARHQADRAREQARAQENARTRSWHAGREADRLTAKAEAGAPRVQPTVVHVTADPATGLWTVPADLGPGQYELQVTFPDVTRPGTVTHIEVVNPPEVGPEGYARLISEGRGRPPRWQEFGPSPWAADRGPSSLRRALRFLGLDPAWAAAERVAEDKTPVSA
jgi:hypothetical protein